MSHSALTLRDIQRFIRKELRRKLRTDLRERRLLKEADVECAAYYHLRGFIGNDLGWRVLAHKYVRLTGNYPDLLIYRELLPVIAIELKWNQRNIGEKDRKSLNRALTELGVNKAYWISTDISDKPKNPIIKEAHEKYVLQRILVRPGFSGQQLRDFQQYRKRLRSRKTRGKGRKLIKK